MSWPLTVPKGKPARGHIAKDYRVRLYKVSVGWTPEQLDAINRRVVRNGSHFGKEARRLIDIGLRNDHMDNA